MVITSHPQRTSSPSLQDFLQQKVGVSEKALNLGIRQAEIEQAPLPIILWSFGLLNLLQYQQVLDWQRDHH